MKKPITYLATLLFTFCFSFSTIQAQQPMLKVSTGHGSGITTFNYSPDGKYIVSGGDDNSVRLWDIVLGKEIRIFKGHTKKVTYVCFSPDGKEIASASEDETVKIWDMVSGKIITTYSGGTGLNSVVYSPDGNYFITADLASIDVWNAKTREHIRTIGTTEEEKVYQLLCISPDSKTIACKSISSVVFWDINSGNKINTISFFLRSITSMTFSSDGTYIILGSREDQLNSKLNSLDVYDVLTARLIKSFSVDKYPASANMSPDSKYIAISEGSRQTLWDFNTEERIKLFNDHSYVEDIKFTPDGKNLVVANSSELVFYDLNTLQEVKSIKSQSYWVLNASLSPNGQYFVNNNTMNRSLIDLNTAKENSNFNKNNLAHLFVFSPDGKFLATAGSEDVINILDIENNKIIKSFHEMTRNIKSINFSADGNFLLFFGDYGVVPIDLNKNETIYGKDWFPNVTSGGLVMFSPNGKQVASIDDDKGVIIWDFASGRLINTIKETTCYTFQYSPDGNYMATAGSSNVNLWDVRTSKIVKSFGYDMYSRRLSDEIKKNLAAFGHVNIVTTLDFSADGKYLLTGSDDSRVILWDVESGKIIKEFEAHSGAVKTVQFFPDGKHIFSSSEDCTIRVWDINTGSWVAFVQGKSAELVFTSDNYWDGSLNCSSLVSMVNGLQYWDIDQFAVKNNRPDIILQRLGSTDKELIKHYYKQYQKRLRRLGITSEQLADDYHVPTSSITQATQKNKFIELSFNIADSLYNLKHYNIFVNDVPIFGTYGKEIDGKSANLKETIELTTGENKIEISCMNDRGVSSFRALTYATYTGESKKNLYFLGLGVSKYQNPTYNLQYADKDATDLSKVMESYKGNGFDSIYTKLLVNEQVTPENIQSAKAFIKNAKPDDTFILFIAGHGMHDNDADATYYYLTSNSDINNLRGTAANFKSIEDLLQGIPPRNKLFLMDACESGELDDDIQGEMVSTATETGMASRGFKKSPPTIEPIKAEVSTSSSSTSTKRSYLYQKDRYIYNDLARRSGAIVFSSSKGGELSYERSDIENGLFTENIIKALSTRIADVDFNRSVSTDELRDYVSKQVAEASNNLQHPTVDRDNISLKFGFGRDIDFEMVEVKGGTIFKDNKHKDVITTQDFEIGKYEVTQEQWKYIMGNNPSLYSDCPTCPVDNVSWEEVNLFITKLKEQTHFSYRLPTQTEWLYAARGGSSNSPFFSGSKDKNNVVWFKDNSNGKTHPVGTKRSNQLGIYDLSGNVCELCQDWTDAAKKPSKTVVCGGDIENTEMYIFKTEKISLDEKATKSTPRAIGFRLVLPSNYWE